MGNDLVVLRIAEADGGRSIDLLQPRWRAEAIVAEGLNSWPRYILTINPEPSMAEKLKAAVKAAVDFVSGHKSELATAIAYLAALPVPTPYHQVLTLAAVLLGAVAGTKYGQ